MSDDITEEQKERSNVFVRFIDILFAVVLGQSFVFLSSERGMSAWIAAPSQNLVTFADVGIAYTLVVTSWVGYHYSTRILPIKNVFRFVVDIALLFLYYLTFVNVQSFALISIILFLVFLLYFVWTAIRLVEYPNERKRLNLDTRAYQAGGFAIAFFVIALLRQRYSLPQLEGMLLLASVLLLVGYRALYWGGPHEARSKKRR